MWIVVVVGASPLWEIGEGADSMGGDGAEVKRAESESLCRRASKRSRTNPPRPLFSLRCLRWASTGCRCEDVARWDATHEWEYKLMSPGCAVIVRECRDVGQTPGPWGTCVQALLSKERMWGGCSLDKGLTAFSPEKSATSAVEGFVRLSTDELAETPLDQGRPIEEDDERMWGVERLRECSRRCPLNELR